MPGNAGIMQGNPRGMYGSGYKVPGECRGIPGEVWKWVQSAKGMKGNVRGMKGSGCKVPGESRGMQGNARGM